MAPALYDRLATLKLVEPHPQKLQEQQDAEAKAQQLEVFISGYIASRTDAKPRTTTNMNLARRQLVEFFGADRPLGAVTRADAKQFAIDLRRKYAEATVARTVKRARQFFNAAIDARLIAENPFSKVPVGQMHNRDRLFFVTRGMTTQILDACPDAEWRAIVALCRYGGLRCPSELLSLTWADILWDRDRF